MTWNRMKRIFGRGGENGQKIPELTILKAADNEWGVPVLDVRPVTQTMQSTSGDCPSRKLIRALNKGFWS